MVGQKFASLALRTDWGWIELRHTDQYFEIITKKDNDNLDNTNEVSARDFGTQH